MFVIRRVFLGVARLNRNDKSYFVAEDKLAARQSQFRHDIRAAVGCALAFSFVAAGLTQVLHLPVAGPWITLLAGVIGGLSGKTLLA